MPREQLYCFTCKRWIPPAWLVRHMASERHRNCVLGIPPPPFTWKKGKTDDEDEPEEDASTVENDEEAKARTEGAR